MTSEDHDRLHPEQRARVRIDGMLTSAGWVVQDYKAVNLYAGTGVAVRELVTHAGPADYVLFVNRQAVGVVEAKKKGTTLPGVALDLRRVAPGARVLRRLPHRAHCHARQADVGFFNKNLVMEYGFPEAVADGVKVDFDVFRLSTAIEETERFRRFSDDELVARDKASLDIFWLRDESLEDTDNLSSPGVIAAGIVEDLEAALAEFTALAESLQGIGVEIASDE